MDYTRLAWCHEPLVHETWQSRSAGGASSTQRRGKHIEGMTILSVAHFMGGTKLFLRTDPSGGLSHQYFRSPAASDVERVHVNAMQSRRIKVLGREQSQPSSYFVLHSHPLTNHVEQPAIQFQSEPAIRFKSEPATSSPRWITASTAANVSIRALVTVTILTVLTYNA